MQALLAAEGEQCSLGFVHRLMQAHQLQARRRRRWHRTTRSRPGDPIFANLCQTADGLRDFTATHPADRVVSDISMVRTEEGWVYLATVIDLATRAVVGWSVATHMQATLVTSALDMAWTHRGIRAGTVLHSDHGSQYTSHLVRTWCQEHKMQQSMGATGVCWDNAVAESWFATLKGDLPDHRIPDLHWFRVWLLRYIDVWYNRVRPHSYTNGIPPITAWTKLASQPFGVSFP